MILSFLIVIAEIGAILTISIFKSNSGQLIDQTWQELNTKSHYIIQDQLTCCGLSGPSDYESSRDIDQSCYHREPLLPNNIDQPGNLVIREESPNSSLSNRLQSNRILNSSGCRQRISDWFFENRLLILAVSGSILLYQILTMLLTSAAISFSRRRRHESLEELDASSEHHHANYPGGTYMWYNWRHSRGESRAKRGIVFVLWWRRRRKSFVSITTEKREQIDNSKIDAQHN